MLVILVWPVVFAACGDEHHGPQTETGPAAIFRPLADGPVPFGEIPWPSDLYLAAEGRMGPVPGLDRLAAYPSVIEKGLASLDGFGRASGGVFFVEEPVDEATLPHEWKQANAGSAGILLVDIDDRSERFGRRYPVYARYVASYGCVSVIPVPGVVLPPGVRHALVLTRRVHSAAGQPLSMDTELARIAELDPAARGSRAEHLYGDAMDRLEEARAVERRDIAGLAVFTTSRRVEELPRLRERLKQEPPPRLLLSSAEASPYTVAVFGIGQTPTLDDWLGAHPERDESGDEWPGGDNPGGIAHDQIAVIATGAFVAPSFLNRSSGHFETDASGEVVLAQPAAKVPVTLMIPRAPAPPGGYPVVIHGHGLSNHRGSMLGIVNEIARAGFAMIAIDDVKHGSRQGIPDVHNNFGGEYVGPDGIPDATGLPIAFFNGFSDFVAVRDNFRQTVLDESSLVRLIHHVDLSPLAAAAGGPVPRLDPSRIFWSGGSLGGIMGAMTIAVEPEIRAAALQVPGASFVQLITTNSAEVAPLVGTIARTLLGVKGGEVIDEFHPVANLLAAVSEGGDPIAYAPHVMADPLTPERTPPDVLISYAAGDEVLPNISTVALIRALGLELARPSLAAIDGVSRVRGPVAGNLANGRTGAAVQYMPANHGLGYARYDTRKFVPGVPLPGADRFPTLPATIRFEQPIREHTAQLVEFLVSAASEPVARIELTATPVADYDGDGISDEVELEQGTDPSNPESRQPG